jgi:hypothetical protein
VLAASVVADFECAFANYVTSTSFLSDQFLGASGNLNAKNWGTKKIPNTDAQNARAACSGATGLGAYTPLHTARFQSDDVVARLTAWTDQEAGLQLAPLRAQVAAYGAYAYTLLGEGYCAMRFDEGPIITPAAVMAIAEQKFTAALALAQAGGNADILNLVRVGRARVLLNLGKKTEAAADAALVTAGWQFMVTRGAETNSRHNHAYRQHTENRHTSVAPQYRNLMVGNVPDPRVVVKFGPDIGLLPTAFDGVTPLYVVNNKNLSRSAPMRMASYVEAQLIRAEALGGTAAVGLINARRSQLSLPDYTGATDPASIQALILDERNREFFMEGGQRFNDLLRFQIPWKTGNDQNGVPYGTTTCMPLPQTEESA